MAEVGNRVVTYPPKSGECAVCGKEGSLRCGRCQVDFYCGREHQVQHWPQHCKGCGSIEVRENSDLGRYVVATKDIPAGAILMREVPLVATPSYGPTENQPVCVGCFAVPKVVRQCSKCGWPVCGEACSKEEHHQPECAAFQRAKFKLPKAKLRSWDCTLWTALAALRVTLACEDKARGDMLQNLQHNHSPLQNCLQSSSKMKIAALLMIHDRAFRKHCEDAVSWVRDVAGLTWLTPEAIRRGAGICFINSTGCSGRSGRKVTGVFAGISMVEHSCRPNTDTVVWQREDDPLDGVGSMEYVLVASRDIARGEHLDLAYQHNFLLGSIKRRAAILSWAFLCECALCSDPSQRGLHLEAWCCGACSDKKKKAFTVTICDMENRWSCGGCGEKGSMEATGDSNSAYGKVKRLERRLQSFRENTSQVPLKEWERFITDALWPRGPLHPTHTLVLEAKKEITALHPVEVLMATLTAAESRRVAGYCRDLLAVCDVVCPGINTYRQTLLLVLAGLVEGQMQAQMNQSLRTMRLPQPKDTAALLDELEEHHTELLRIAVSPKPKRTTLNNLDEIAETRSSLSMMQLMLR